MQCHFCGKEVAKPKKIPLPKKKEKVPVCAVCENLAPVPEEKPAAKPRKKKPAAKKAPAKPKETPPAKKKPAPKKASKKKPAVKEKEAPKRSAPARGKKTAIDVDSPIIRLMLSSWEAFAAGCEYLGIDALKAAKNLSGMDVIPQAPDTPPDKAMRLRVGAKKCSICGAKYAELNDDWHVRVLMRATKSLSASAPLTVRAMSMSKGYLRRRGYSFICPPCVLENMEPLTEMARGGQPFKSEDFTSKTKASVDAIKEDEEFFIKKAKEYLNKNGE